MPELPELLLRSRERFDPLCEQALSAGNGLDAPLIAAMRYAMQNGGKRVRPALAWGACLAVGGDWLAADSAALAVECIHGYSLVHDDLPCMDDDDLRRGQPTCHRRFDEATALLAGDALQAMAFQLLGSSDLSADIRSAQMTTLATAAFDMVVGQRLDLAAEGRQIDREALERIHAHKTGALIRAAVATGALAGGASPDQREVLDTFARHLGLAFQVQDDILDVIGDTQVLGKQAGADQALAKSTYPALMGLDAARALAASLHADAVAALVPLGEAAIPLTGLAHFLLQRDH